jgi:integrase
MAEQLPVRKYVRVWVMRRKNNVRKKSKAATVSYTLQWSIYGQKSVLSLGRAATLAYAKRMAVEKERELNAETPSDVLKPITWEKFRTEYFNTFYPGHDLPAAKRHALQQQWGKSFNSMRSERLAMDNFTRLAKPDWCHQITTAHREKFVTDRLAEVGSAASVDSDLRALRAVFNIMEEWKHRPDSSNPFAGRGKATVGARRTRKKQQGRKMRPRHYSFEDVKAILSLATQEVTADPTFAKKRLRALIYFVAYTGCRINEAIHLEWSDIAWEEGIAWLNFKIENDLKTPGSAAPFGLPDKLVAVLREWEKEKTCNWVFPNTANGPWKTGGRGFKHLDQLKELAKRAGVDDATWKRFRHALSTHGKQRFGMTKEQIQAQLRHASTDTQKHYDHDDLANLRKAMKEVDFEA